MKKILSLVLCTCLLLSLCIFANAEGGFTPGEYEASAPGFGGTVCVPGGAAAGRSEKGAVRARYRDDH